MTFDLKIDTKTGIHYYEFPKGTSLYRTLGRQITDDTLHHQNTYFALNKDTVIENYAKQGYPYEFETTKDMKVVAVDMDNQKFYDGAPEEIKKILKEQYGMNDGNKRNSETHKDNKVLEHICDKYSNKFMGYGANEMNTFFSHMHAEIALCKKYIGNVTKSGPVSLTKSQEDDYTRNKMEHEDREQRKNKNKSKRIRHLSPISPPSLNTKSHKKITPFKLFDNDSYESPPSSPRRQLFSGGKTSNRRKRTPKKKTRKNKPHKPNKPNKQNRPHKN